MMPLPRAAIYGGTFDPVHTGHLEVARKVLELFELEEVLFVPACVPPHKSAISSVFHRLQCWRWLLSRMRGCESRPSNWISRNGLTPSTLSSACKLRWAPTVISFL